MSDFERKRAGAEFGVEVKDGPTEFEQGLREAQITLDNPAQAAILASGMDPESLRKLEEAFGPEQTAA